MSMRSMQCLARQILLPALFAAFNHHDDWETPNRQPPAG